VLVLGAEALVESLRRLGVTPVVARDGAEARALLAEGAWALLLCRWPGDGYGAAGLLEGLRGEGRVPGLPVLALLERADPRAIVAAVHAGASACVVEPVTDPELRARLELALGRRPGGG
jgi:DNA-binding response OmpR family regulator